MTTDPSGNTGMTPPTEPLPQGQPPTWGPAEPQPQGVPYQDMNQYGFPPPQPPKQNRRSGLIALAVLLGIVVVAAGGYYLFRDRLAGSAAELAVGDCIDEPAGTTDIKEVQHQPCSDPHDGEVFAIVMHTAAPGAAYPDQSEFRDLAGDECVPLLSAYTGMDLVTFVAAGLDFSAFYPTSEAWNNGDRSVTCYVVKADSSKLTGSVHNLGSSPLPT